MSHNPTREVLAFVFDIAVPAVSINVIGSVI